ncbi:chemotaxis protein CheW [bacterium]|nr:chemotaxis protein CheW [bacterium]
MKNLPSGFESGGRQMFLLFRVNGELYGTPLSGVREVVPFQKPRPVPNTKKNYLGIINLRGEISGVVDMRLWFEDNSPASNKAEPKALIVVESSLGLMAIAADAVETICQLESKEIEYAKSIPSSFSAGGMIGLARLKQGLATLLDVRALCSHVDVATERKERWAV